MEIRKIVRRIAMKDNLPPEIAHIIGIADLFGMNALIAIIIHDSILQRNQFFCIR